MVVGISDQLALRWSSEGVYEFDNGTLIVSTLLRYREESTKCLFIEHALQRK